MKKTILFNNFTEEYDKWCERNLNRSKIIQRYHALNGSDKPSGIVLVINEDNDVITYTELGKKLSYTNNRWYVKNSINCSLTIYKNNKKIRYWIGKNCFLQNPFLFKKLFSYLNIDWITQIDENILRRYMNKTLFEGIIFGRITNPEKFYKKIMSVSFKISKSSMISWHLIKEYIECQDYFLNKGTLCRIINHTTNVNKALEKVVRCIKERGEITPCETNKANEWLTMFSDSLDDAEILDKKINPLWSFNRLREEHVNMTRLINSYLIEDKNAEPIYFENEDGFLSCCPNNGVKLLKSEKDVCAEGNTMSHCLYNCYWEDIKRKVYFAFSAEYPERCTIGVRPNSYNRSSKPETNGEAKFILDQIYKKYDENVTDETREYFEDWINSDEMQKFFKTNYQKLKPDIDIESTNNAEIAQIAV